MAFTMNCTSKGCCKVQEPYLDVKDNKVYCSECDQEIVNVSHFTKIQMKSIKQFKQKKAISFSVKCPHCQKEDRPKLLNQDILCSGCNKPMNHLSEPFKVMLREKLKTVGKDV